MDRTKKSLSSRGPSSMRAKRGASKMYMIRSAFSRWAIRRWRESMPNFEWGGPGKALEDSKTSRTLI